MKLLLDMYLISCISQLPFLHNQIHTCPFPRSKGGLYHMTKVKTKITPDTILKNFWKDNKRFADLFNACFFDGNPKLNPDDLTEVDTDVSSLLAIPRLC